MINKRLVFVLGVLWVCINAGSVQLAWNLPTHLSSDISVGDSITWTTTDGLPHTVTFDNGMAVSGTIQSGSASDSFSFTFNTAGAFTYHCSVHGAALMSGTVNVTSGNTPPIPGRPLFPVLPVLECVNLNTDGTFTASYGYYNPTGGSVDLSAASPSINFVNTGATPPSVFLPGRQYNVFNATAPIGATANWTLITAGQVNSAVGTANSHNCSLSPTALPLDIVPLVNCTIIDGNFFTAIFGYVNTNFNEVQLPPYADMIYVFSPVMGQSRIEPQVSTYFPGRTVNAWNITLAVGFNVTWRVFNEFSGSTWSVTADAGSPLCQL